MNLCDAHCHLADDTLFSRFPEVLDRSQKAGIVSMVCCGTSEKDWDRVEALASGHSEVVPAFGLHPWYVASASSTWQSTLFQKLSQSGAVVGEAGLDFACDDCNENLQQTVFSGQLSMARELGRPIVIHCRKAWGALWRMLDACGGLPVGGVVHSYSGPRECVAECEKRGLYVSFSGSIANPQSIKKHAAVAAVSPERLLIETDAPFMLPFGRNAEFNEPAYLIDVLSGVAKIRNVPDAELTENIWKNYCTVFGLKKCWDTNVVGAKKT